MSNVFKAYDVRGIYPEEINKDIAFRVGGATVKFLNAKTLVVGEDCRNSSPAIRGAIVDAITRAGAKVYYIGSCTTPLFYFSVNKLKADGGIMVTASHNPPQYGGLKIVGLESQPIGSETGLKEIEKISQNNLGAAEKAGIVEEANFVSEYADFVIRKSGVNPANLKNLKLVIDAGNGMTPLVLGPLMSRLGISFTPLYFEIDCNFPNHSPDISKAESLNALREKVIAMKADLGIAFDGDGDRVSFIDIEGNKIDSGFVLALLFKAQSGIFNKPKTVYDLRFSKSVKELFGNYGIKSRVGHSFIKELMRKYNADIGGELSGHFFFKEMGYVESSVLAMLKILKIVSDSRRPISELIKPFQKYYHSGEINIDITSRELADVIMDKLGQHYRDGKIDRLDGITVEYPDWWFNVRFSNTEPIVRLVVEADMEGLMKEKVAELTQEIKNP